MSMTLRFDQLARLAWIALMILAFVFWWPLGLAILAYTIWSGKMRCCGIGIGNWGGLADRVNETREGWTAAPRASGNRAFDDYRAATLRRLEEEQREFQSFLARLRLAKDKAEFDQFMAERGNPR